MADPFDALALGIAKKYELPEDLFLNLAKKQRDADPELAAIPAERPTVKPVGPSRTLPDLPKFELPDISPEGGVPRVSVAQRALAGEFNLGGGNPPRRPGGPVAAGRPQARPGPVSPGVLPSKPVRLGKLIAPLSTRMSPGSEFGVPDAEGAPNARGQRFHAGKDWFAPARSAVRSPWAGRIVEVKRSRGNSGQVFGGVVKIERADGVVFVARHVDPRGLRVGQRVRPGQVVAGVSPWTGGSPHAHIELWRTLGGGYRYENMIDPASVFRK